VNGKWYGIGAVVLALFVSLGAGVAADEAPTGAWVEEVILTEQESYSEAVTQIDVGELDVFTSTIGDPELYQRVQDIEHIDYEQNFGSYNEISFNPAGPEFEGTGELNPFAVKRIREAMNWLIDRHYIVDEIQGGLGSPRWSAVNTVFPDHARHIETIRALEVKYAYDPGRAEEVINEEMEALGAEMVDGTWHYDGDPVELIFIIRSEDERQEMGDYIATELEDIGFQVDRQYMTGGEASPIWIAGNPHDGRWHLYTGGWISTIVNRDLATNFDFFFTERGMPEPLWQAYDPSPEFDEVARRLATRDFSTIAEREELFEQALEMALEESQRIFLTDDMSFMPRADNISVGACLAAGIEGSYLWAYTLRDEDEELASLDMAMSNILVEPWNALAGSNWVFDQFPIRGTSSIPAVYDPFTGIHWNHLMEEAEVVIQEGLPVDTTLDWVDLEFAEEIAVPEDAWIGWDPVEQVFSTVGEEHPDGLTARRKVTITYPEAFYDENMWHDGSTLDMADLLLPMILAYDRAKEESDVFDQAEVSPYESFVENFRGFRILSEDPITIEYYSETFYLDAEENAYWAAQGLWPEYAQGVAGWHTLGLGLLVEASGEAAHSAAKADREDAEWLSMIAGPSLGYLEEQFEEAQANDYIPYEPTLGQFIDAEDAAERWSNLAAWYEDKGHFWVGNGPLYLRDVHPVEGVIELARNDNYLAPADKWDHFEEPMIADVDVDGPSTVQAGDDAEFMVEVTFEGEPYRIEDMDAVVYLLFDAEGTLVETAEAEAVEDGLWRITVAGDVTEDMPVGGADLEVVASPLLVAMPTAEDQGFVIIR